MAADRHITLYHWPQSRSAGVLTLLEELQADYEVSIVDIREAKHKSTNFMQINPMGKLPTIRHGDAVVTEQIAVYTYLADLYADRSLAPSLDDPLRGAHLRWMAFYAGCFEPAIVDLSLKREAGPASMLPYGSFELVWSTLCTQLSRGPYILGDRFTAGDVLWGAALDWMAQFKLTPDEPVVQKYVKRITERDAFRKTMEMNKKFMEKYSAT